MNTLITLEVARKVLATIDANRAMAHSVSDKPRPIAERRELRFAAERAEAAERGRDWLWFMLCVALGWMGLALLFTGIIEVMK